MKVMYLTNLTVPYRMKFFNELSKDCDLTVVVERKQASNRNKEWLNSVIHKKFELIELNAKAIGEESSFSLKILKHITSNYDMVIIGGYSTFTAMLAIIYLKFKGKPFILNADGGVINRGERKIVYFIKKFFISSATNWITTSEKAKEYLSYYGAAEKDIFIYPFSSICEKEIIDVNPSEKKKIRNKLSIDSDKVMILTVGQIIHRKGFDILLEACKNIKMDIMVYIVGGKTDEKLKQIIDYNNLDNIHFVEFLDENLLSQYYQAADLFVLPSRFDVWGLVINEAIAHSLPVISSDSVGAAIEIFKNDDKVLFKSENSIDLAIKINQVFEDKDFIYNSSIKSRNFAEEYTIEKMANKHIEIFREIMNKKSRK